MAEPWRRRDHEPAAICDSGGAVVRAEGIASKIRTHSPAGKGTRDWRAPVGDRVGERTGIQSLERVVGS
jgi:hypothetical protein